LEIFVKLSNSLPHLEIDGNTLLPNITYRVKKSRSVVDSINKGFLVFVLKKVPVLKQVNKLDTSPGKVIDRDVSLKDVPDKKTSPKRSGRKRRNKNRAQ